MKPQIITLLVKNYQSAVFNPTQLADTQKGHDSSAVRSRARSPLTKVRIHPNIGIPNEHSPYWIIESKETHPDTTYGLESTQTQTHAILTNKSQGRPINQILRQAKTVKTNKQQKSLDAF